MEDKSAVFSNTRNQYLASLSGKFQLYIQIFAICLSFYLINKKIVVFILVLQHS